MLCSILVSVCLPIGAHAAPLYTVSINGADSLTSLLTEHLEIARRNKDKTNVDEMSEDEIRRLVAITPSQIRSLLATEGYFTPSVSSDFDQQSTPWIARFNVTLGPSTRIASVNIQFAGDIVQKHPQRITELRDAWSLKVDDPFQQGNWDRAKSSLLKGLLNRDYPAASLTQSEARIEPSTNSAALTVVVDSGPAFTFGEIQIDGLKRYSRDMVDKLNPITPGEPYSQEKLNELQARVQETGYFRSSFATIDVNPDHPNNVVIKLDLSENELKRLSLGIGFSTDGGPRGQLKWMDRHFLGRDWRLESELRGDRDTRVLGGDVYFPTLRNDWRPSVGAHYKYTDSAGEINNKFQTGVRLSSPDKNEEKVWALDFLADRQRIGDDFANDREAFFASFTYTRRRVDNLITPSRGYYASLEINGGPAGIVNKESFIRVVGRGTWLSPTYNRFQAVLRGQVGQVFGAGSDTVPGDLLFRTGGDQTVRGYAYNTLGVDRDGAIVGGTNTAVVSAELIYKVTPEWGAAIFTDAGNAANSWDGFRLKHGSGVGARWLSPIGSVNLDLAYGHETGETRLHFSVGYGF